jgi:hypothetical protein
MKKVPTLRQDDFIAHGNLLNTHGAGRNSGLHHFLPAKFLVVTFAR